MKKEKMELEIRNAKNSSKLKISTELIAVSFLIFIFILTVKPEILSTEKIVAAQMVLSIPFLLTSALIRSKMTPRKMIRWEVLGYISFILGYAFLVNTVGILISLYALFIGILFFVVNWILVLTYSSVDISYHKSRIKSRFLKDGFFILVQIFLGLLPALGAY